MVATTQSARSTSDRTRSILIADDSASVRASIRGTLEAYGYVVCGEAKQGLEAIERATELKPDLILLDFAMPTMNGVEAAAVLKRLMPDIPIVLLSVYGDTIGKLAPMLGVKAVLSKSDGVGPLIQCVRSLLP
jgi:CheY-like chemotaxis protein